MRRVSSVDFDDAAFLRFSHIIFNFELDSKLAQIDDLMIVFRLDNFKNFAIPA
jgi:hypothetical protein